MNRFTDSTGHEWEYNDMFGNWQVVGKAINQLSYSAAEVGNALKTMSQKLSNYDIGLQVNEVDCAKVDYNTLIRETNEQHDPSIPRQQFQSMTFNDFEMTQVDTSGFDPVELENNLSFIQEEAKKANIACTPKECNISATQTKELKARFCLRKDTLENWKKSNVIPLDGELIIIRLPDKDFYGMQSSVLVIGDGEHTVLDLFDTGHYISF